jgi:hypothetical protein
VPNDPTLEKLTKPPQRTMERPRPKERRNANKQEEKRPHSLDALSIGKQRNLNCFLHYTEPLTTVSERRKCRNAKCRLYCIHKMTTLLFL